MTLNLTSLRRRHFVGSGLACAVVAVLPARLAWGAAAAGPDAPRFVLVLLRGGLDGLAAVPAVGDPAFATARGLLGHFPEPALPLQGPFALHPALAQLHASYLRGEALVVHATGLPYRERSHFDAQQVLESGGTHPHQLSTGWLARALNTERRRAIALNTAVPLVLRGPGEIDTWAPSALPEPGSDLVMRLERLYAGDAALARALARARGLRDDPSMSMALERGAMVGSARNAAAALARKAGEFIGQPTGPQVAVLEFGGWDTHANQSAPNGALVNNLRILDGALASLRDTLTASGAWGRTAVLVVTEFGREVAVNGTQGTDHGSGGAAFLLGGAVAGGRVIADWPGLAPKDRFEGRDLRITTDLRAVFASVLTDHLRLPRRTVEQEALPGSASLPRLDLLRG